MSWEQINTINDGVILLASNDYEPMLISTYEFPSKTEIVKVTPLIVKYKIIYP
jgi:hypothetical protein